MPINTNWRKRSGGGAGGGDVVFRTHFSFHYTHTRRAIQYARYICILYITEQDYNRSRAMASEKNNRSNITVTIECTSFRQSTTNNTHTNTCMH